TVGNSAETRLAPTQEKPGACGRRDFTAIALRLQFSAKAPSLDTVGFCIRSRTHASLRNATGEFSNTLEESFGFPGILTPAETPSYIRGLFLTRISLWHAAVHRTKPPDLIRSGETLHKGI